jgi:hypothetical protein
MKYLPIGSVVQLKNTQKRVMIIGLKQKEVSTGIIWDYSGCFYPEGVIDPEKLFLFNKEQIARLYFVGFQDGEALQLLEKLNTDEESSTENY